MGRSVESTTSRAELPLLVVDDESPLLRSLGRLLRPMCTVELAKGCESACEVLERGPVLGVIVDLVLPDGDGFHVIERARAQDPGLPTLLITGYLDPNVAARAFSMGVTFLPKPLTPENVLAFARRCLAQPKSAILQLEALGDDWQGRYHLTPTERDLLVATARGMPREELLSTFGIAPTTLKRHVTNLLLKTKEASLDRAALRFLREMLRNLE